MNANSLRLILLIDKEKQNNKSGQISKFLEMSAQVKLTGQLSNCFAQDLQNILNLRVSHFQI
jgi:hypothetical protein